MQKYLIEQNEIGIDEAGRGPLFGRVYAGAVIWDPEKNNDIIKDSKKLTPKKRKIALEWIKSNVKAWGVGFAEPEEIDKINILEATKLAMDRAIENLCKSDIKPTNIIIDGIGWEKKFNGFNIKSVVKGDANFYSIASASIIAKEYHDEHIKELCEKNPELNEKYAIGKNMGYGTAKHIEGIKKYGLTLYHRKSFKLKKID